MKNVRYAAMALLMLCFAGCAKEEVDALWDYSECEVGDVVVAVEATKATLEVYFTRPCYNGIEFSWREAGNSVWNEGGYTLHYSADGYMQTVEVKNLTPATTYQYVFKYTLFNYYSPYNVEVDWRECSGVFTTLALDEKNDETNRNKR